MQQVPSNLSKHLWSFNSKGYGETFSFICDLSRLNAVLIHDIYPSNINLHPFTLRQENVKYTKL